jgi:hypothetical protein
MQVEFTDDGLGCDGMYSSLPGQEGYGKQCFSCARPHRDTYDRCHPAIHAVMVVGYQHAQMSCLHRVHAKTVDPALAADKPAMCGGVDDTTPRSEGVPA